MKRKLTLLFVFYAILHASFYAQSLNYSGVNNFDLATSTHIGEYGVPSLERRPTGMIYGDSGNKLYVVGSIGDFVIQYDLSTAYDLSSRSAIKSYFRVNSEESNPEDVLFNDDGTKMYILGGAGDDVTEYTLSTAWDLFSIDTATNVPVIFNAEAAIDTYLSPTTSHGDNLTGFRFNDDGTKLFILDRSGSDRVFEFSLDTAYDISTSGAVDAVLDVSGLEGNSRAMEFNNDGTELYIIGISGDDVNTFNLGTGYDLTTSGTSSTSIVLAEGEPSSILLNDDGTTFYIAGFIDQEIKEYSLGTAYDFSSSITLDDTYAAPTIERNPHGMVFNNDGTKLFTVGSTLDMISEITLSIPYDISTGNLTNGLYINTDENNVTGIAFNSTGSVLYVTGNDDDGINQYALSSVFDLSSTVTHSGPFSVNITETNNENSPRDLVFNGDGSKLFVLGNGNDRVYQFNLSTNYDLSSLATDYAGEYNVNPVDTAPQGLAFNNDGTKFYIAGNTGDDINEFTIENAFDVTTGTITNTNTFSIATEETTILDVVFNDDGSRFYIVGSNGDDMNQYYTKGLLPETPNDGTIDDTTNPFLITLSGDTFFASSGDFTDTEVTISGVPEGLTAVLTLNSNTEAELTFTGKANSHLNSDEAAANLSFTFLDAAFTTSNAADVTNAVAQTDVLGFDFIECADDEIVYNGGWTGGSGVGGAPDNTDGANAIRVQGNITITADTNCDCLNVESGQTLTIADGVELTVANALELDGDLRLLGSAQLIQTHTGVKNASGAGNLYKSVMGTLENVYQSGYWTSPVTTNGSTFNIAGVLKDGSETLTATTTPLDITFSSGFDGATGTAGVTPITLSTRWLAKFVNSGAWTEQINETSELLNPGEGFNKKSTGQSGGQNYIFVGRPNDGEYTHTIDAFGSGTWSLLGNPYPSPLDIDQFTTDNSTAIEGSIYFYESGTSTSTHNGSAYTGGYATRFMNAGNSAYDNDNTLTGLDKIPGQYIGVGQGFFVEASATGGTITFNNAQREFNTPNVFFSRNYNEKKTTNFPILRIGFEFLNNGKTYHRPVTIGFRDFINSESEYKGAEMWDFNPTDMALKLGSNNLPYVITMLESFNYNLTVPLKVKSDTNRDVTFKVNEVINLETYIFLYDAVTQIYYDITSNDAIVNIDAGEYNNRFFITFNSAVLDIIDNELNNIKIVNNKNELFIKSQDVISKVLIYNILGQRVFLTNKSIKKTELKINTASYKKGVYLIKIKNSKGFFTKKILIH